MENKSEVETELRNEVSGDWGKEGRNQKESGKTEGGRQEMTMD